MNDQASPRVALVTGGSRGIGAAIVRRLAKDGFAVAINYASSAAEADALAGEVRQTGGRALAVRADVAKPDDVRAMFDAVHGEFGRIDVLVNSAGVQIGRASCRERV